jgi:hypothetical protein
MLIYLVQIPSRYFVFNRLQFNSSKRKNKRDIIYLRQIYYVSVYLSVYFLANNLPKNKLPIRKRIKGIKSTKKYNFTDQKQCQKIEQ